MEAEQVDELNQAQVFTKNEIIEQNNFGHIYRKKTNLELIRLSFIITGVEFIYSVENAFLAPILLEAGLDHTAMTWAFGISPTLGILFAPLIASISDRCNSSFGRRRPFILALSCGILVGLTLVPHGIYLGQLLGDDPQILTGFKWAVLFTIVGTFILDFDTENTQTMSRSYFLDVCVSDDHAKIMSMSTVMGGIGGFTGYLLGGIDWVQTDFGQFLGGNVSTIFSLNTVVFIICLILTITSYKEVPRPFLKKHGLLKLHVNDEEMNAKLNDEEDEKPVKPLFFVSYFKNIIYMPHSMKILVLTNLFSWAAYLSFCMYFTTFVGEVIYKGDPYAPRGSDELLRYEEGVRFGCLGMATLTFTCAIYSAFIEKLIKMFKGRIVYPGAMLIFALGMGALSIFQVKWVAVIGCMTAGVCHSTLFVMPYLLIAQYHSKGSFKVKDGNEISCKQDRGLGGDIAITNSMLFVAQLSLSIFLGPLITLVNSTAVIVYTASIFSFLAAISATQIVYMDI